MNKPKLDALIFGASQAGKNFLNRQSDYNVLAAIDNDVNKHGDLLEGVQIISPNSIKDYQYDQIIITSQHTKDMKAQLIEEYDIPPSKIRVPLKKELKKTNEPFSDPSTYQFASKLLKRLIDILNEHQLPYFLNFGTLLGIHRDGDLIRWDDDIDIGVLDYGMGKLGEVLSQSIAGLGEEFDVQWEIKKYHTRNQKLKSVVLAFEDKKGLVNSFETQFNIIFIDDQYAIQETRTAPKIHFEKHETINYYGTDARVPYHYEEYSALNYGDWRTPSKEMTNDGQDTNFY